MPIIANTRTFYCDQEREIVARLQKLDVDGFLAHNVLLPDTQRSNLPNEHDIVLLLPWGAYTIESKRWRFPYMLLRGNTFAEWARTPAQLGESPERIIVKCRENPLAIAWRKAQILRSQYVLQTDRLLKRYPVNAIVVVPEHTRVVTEGSAQFDQLRVCRIDELCQGILADRDSYKGQLFSQSDFKRVFEALGALPQVLDAGYAIGNFSLTQRVEVAEPGCPVRVDTFRGVEMIAGEKVEVRLYDTAGRDEETERFLRRVRRRLKALRRAKDPKVVAVAGLLELPECLLVAFERPNCTTLLEAVAHRVKLPMPLAAGLVEHLTDTVQRLHDKRIFHLDIRPTSVLVAGGLESHHGIQHYLAGLTNPLIDEGVGSAVVFNNSFDESFAAPELRAPRHEDRDKATVDVFSLGALLAFSTMGESRYRERIDKGTVAPDSGNPLCQHD